MISNAVALPDALANLRFALRVWRGAAVAALLTPLAACVGGAPSASSTPSAEPTPAPGVERTVGLLLNEPGSFPGYTLFSKTDTAYLIDHQGRLIHTWPTSSNEVKLLENGNLLGGERGAHELAPDGSVVWEYVGVRQHHDLLRLPNGNTLLLVESALTQEEAVAEGANPDLISDEGLRGARLIEIRPTGPASGEIVWEWSIFDHLIQDFDPSKPNYGAVEEHPELVDINFAVGVLPGKPEDWTHPNALDYNAELDQIMITLRHFSEAWIIDHSASAEEAAGHSGGNAGRGGDLLYRWGNPRAYRAGTVDDQRLFWPHNAHWIPDGLPGAGNMLVFNNGDGRPPERRRSYSSVDEVVLPSDGFNYRLEPGSAYGPPEPVWSYAANPPGDFYSPTLSGAQRLPNGNTLICDGDSGVIFEVTPDGGKVWEYVNPRVNEGPLLQGQPVPILTTRRGADITDNRFFRAYRHPTDYPGLQALDLTPGDPIELPSAPQRIP